MLRRHGCRGSVARRIGQSPRACRGRRDSRHVQAGRSHHRQGKCEPYAAAKSVRPQARSRGGRFLVRASRSEPEDWEAQMKLAIVMSLLGLAIAAADVRLTTVAAQARCRIYTDTGPTPRSRLSNVLRSLPARNSSPRPKRRRSSGNASTGTGRNRKTTCTTTT